VRSRRAAPKIERTKPGSENDFRVTYTDYKKWTNDRPGDGIDSDQQEYLEDIFKRGDVKRSLKKLEQATEKYVKSGNKKPVLDAADAMRVDNGKEVAVDVLRQVYKMEKAQLDSNKTDTQKKIVEAVNMAKKKIKTASDQEAMISRVARNIVADAGDVPFYFNVFEFIDPGSDDLDRGDIEDVKEAISDVMLDNSKKFRGKVLHGLQRNSHLVRQLAQKGISFKR